MKNNVFKSMVKVISRRSKVTNRTIQIGKLCKIPGPIISSETKVDVY